MAYTTINKSTDYFNTKLYTGDGSSSRSITGVNFQPDWTWVKSRNTANYDHMITDVVRGAPKMLKTNSTAAEESNPGAGGIGSFDSDGFTIATGSINNTNMNNNGTTYVGWNWKANGAGVANTDGSISSTVSANTTSGFSIVSYTGNATAGATVGHGLGSTPKMIIIKRTNTTGNWLTYNASNGNTYGQYLNTGARDLDIVYWNNTSPTDSVFSLGTVVDNNASGSTYIAYCFADVQGYSKFGSYTGTSSEVFIYTGFKPRFILIKKTSEAASWHLFDTSRTVSNGGNQLNKILFPNLNNAEVDDAYNYVDAYSNGFRCFSGTSGQGTETNKNGQTFIYMAFAEAPLVGTNNVPCTAR